MVIFSGAGAGGGGRAAEWMSYLHANGNGLRGF